MAISQTAYESARKRAIEQFQRAGIVLRGDEAASIEVADFGLGDLEREGLEVITYVNTDRCCAKELALFPRQTCPEHLHPPIDESNPGKEETFRCRWGTVYLYVPGEATGPIQANPPGPHYHVKKEIVLRPGDQYTLAPNTPHWFQAGDEGAIISEFSTRSTDESDIFSDPAIQRAPEIIQ
ncbi:MAG TPA: D-lyxose/D-mannose family sugar isomerase [Armatimonadota bacterium]|nr:D-lyxose/D-mannose family sugar isomerase [Armatimonadota bacterium]